MGGAIMISPALEFGLLALYDGRGLFARVEAAREGEGEGEG